MLSHWCRRLLLLVVFHPRWLADTFVIIFRRFLFRNFFWWGFFFLFYLFDWFFFLFHLFDWFFFRFYLFDCRCLFTFLHLRPRRLLMGIGDDDPNWLCELLASLAIGKHAICFLALLC